MSKNNVAYRQAAITVDAYVAAHRRRSTAGRYIVGAKTKEEAVALARSALDNVGSVKFHYWEKETNMEVEYKELKKIYAYDRPKTV